MKRIILKTTLLALVVVGCVSATTLEKKKEKDERLKIKTFCRYDYWY